MENTNLPSDRPTASYSLRRVVQKTRRFLWDFVPDLLFIMGCSAILLMIIEYFFFS